MGSYKADLTEAKLLWQSKKQGQPKGNLLISLAVLRLIISAANNAKLMQPQRDNRHSARCRRTSQQKRITGGSRPSRQTFPLLAASHWDDFQRESTEVEGGMQSWRKQWVERKGAVVYFRLYKICPISPPSRITVRHLENKGTDFLKVARLF